MEHPVSRNGPHTFFAGTRIMYESVSTWPLMSFPYRISELDQFTSVIKKKNVTTGLPAGYSSWGMFSIEVQIDKMSNQDRNK